jgi:hypothetical protein
MKTLVAMVILFSVASAYAQKGHVTDGYPLSNPLLKEPVATPDGILLFVHPYFAGQKSLNPTVIGNTWYDTQTYNSGNLMTRIFEHPDETVGATWMHKGETGTPDRGTAYNYFNGTSWGTQMPHLGNDPNNGFPCYALWGPTGEIIAHYQYISGEGAIKLLRREVKGTGTWQEIILYPPNGYYSIVWHSMITSGPDHEYVHLLAYVYDDPYMGQDDALLYYRSPDGGVTWDINGIIIEGLGSGYFPTVSSLKYSWAQPVGNTIAFTYGFDHFDGLVFKSEDNGTTWEKIVVYQAPYAPFNLPDITETFGCGDGTSAIALDAQGNVHIVFSRMVQFYDIISSPPGGWYFYPTSTEGMIYWNETMPVLDSTIISSYTLEFLEAGGYLVGWMIPDTANPQIPSDQPNYGIGLTSQPQLSIDGDDNLYLVYAALAPDFSNGTYYFRHIYSNTSVNGGTTWDGIKDLTEDIQFIFSECVYPAIAPKIDQKVHILFQEDFTPGTGSGEENYMDYMVYPKEFFVGIQTQDQIPDFQVSQNYPNPATGETHIGIRLEQSADITVLISDFLGKTIRHVDAGKLSAGNHVVTLNLSGLAGGSYLYTVTANRQRQTQKLMIR